MPRLVLLENFSPSGGMKFLLKREKYLQEKGLPLKCFLLLDNTPAHPLDLEKDIVIEFDFFKVKFLLLNATPILQPIDKRVIYKLKKMYNKGLFRKCLETANDTELTLREFLEGHFHIPKAINLINIAWNQVRY